MQEIKGLAELNAKLTALKNVSPKACVKGGYKLVEHAQKNAPFKTGFLKGSGYVEETEKGAEIGFTANYAEVQEFGSVARNIPAKGYLRRAIDEHNVDVLDVIAKEIEKEMEGLI